MHTSNVQSSIGFFKYFSIIGKIFVKDIFTLTITIITAAPMGSLRRLQ